MAVVGLVGWVGLVPVNKVCMLLQWDPRVGRVSLQKGPFLLKGKGERERDFGQRGSHPV